MRKLEDIVKEYMLSKGEDTMHQFPKYLQMAIRTLEQVLSSIGDGHGSTMTAETLLKVPDNKIIPLPPDFISKLVVGHKLKNAVISLVEDQSLSFLDRENCVQEPPHTDPNEYWNTWWYNALSQRDGELTGGMYGMGGGASIGRYKIDKGFLILNTEYRLPHVYLSYVCTLKSVGGKHLVHEYLAPCIEAGMYLRDIQNRSYIPRGEKVGARVEYGRAIKEAYMKLNTFTEQEAYIASSYANIMAPKI
jgi:hypothetical protein